MSATHTVRGTPDGREAATSARLIYVSDRSPGIRRRRRGRGFEYVDARNGILRDAGELERIHRMAIPPAWRDVWICAHPRGHIQATGRDARERKQYRYHPSWREVRDSTKFAQILAFASGLPALRQRIAQDIAAPGLPKRKVVAAVVALLEKSLIRIGNAEYTRHNHSFGLTTLRSRHVHVVRSTVRFRFKGKGGKFHEISINDARLAPIVRRCRELPGYELFQYLDEDGDAQDVSSTDVNEYLRAATRQDFTAKYFRTWLATVLAAHAFQQLSACRSASEAKRNVSRVVEAVAGMLGNTPAICRKCYIHPAVIDAYVAGGFTGAPSSRQPNGGRSISLRSLAKTERAVLKLLRQRLQRDTRDRAA